MSKADTALPAFAIGEWTVISDRGQIEHDGTNIHLEPKVMDVLLRLAETPGQLVSKDALTESVWNGRPVSDIVITRCISVLRSSLGDDSRNPKYIETVPKRGYRLIADVSTVSERPTKRSSEPVKRKQWLVTVILGLAILAGAIQCSHDALLSRPPPVSQSIAVLPFVNMSGAEQQYFCDGISEQLIFTLSEIPGVEIAARTSSFSFRNSDLNIREIAQELGVESVIEGSVRRAGNTVRVTAQLIDSETGYQQWSGSFDGSIEDTFELQERISAEVAVAIGGERDAMPAAEKLFTRPQNFAAYDKYLIARYRLNQRRAEDLEATANLFKESIALDANFGPSYLGLAYTYALLPSYLPVDADETYTAALATLDTGIAIDPNIAGVGAGVRGFVHLKQGDWIAAEQQFQRALQSQYVEPTSYLWYSQLLATVGRLEESLKLAQQGRRIDPLSPVANSRLAIAYLWVGDNEQARRYYDIANTLDIDSAIHTESFALLLVREGRLQDLQDLAPSIRLGAGHDLDWLPALLQYIHDPSTRPSALTAVTDALQQGRTSPRIGFVALGLLETPDELAAFLETLIDNQVSFEYEILFIDELSELRQHPNFASMLVRLELANYWQAVGCEWQNDTVQCED